MELNKNGKLAQFYLIMGNSRLPDDFCLFFWGMVGRLLKLLLMVVIVLFLLAGFAVAFFYIGRAAWHHKLIMLQGIVGAGIIGFLLWWRNQRGEFEVVREIKSVVSTKVDAVKNRYCPRIDWR